MKVVAFVPVKLNNERFPGKNLKKFDDGTPLIRILLGKLNELHGKVLDEIYLYCSDESVKKYLPENVEFLKRPSSLDKNEVKGTDIYEKFVETIDADIYVLAHVTSPFVTIKHIKECVEAVKSGIYDSAFCAKKIQNFLWQNNKPLNFVLNNPPRTQDMNPVFQEQSTPYVFTKELFSVYKARTGVKPYICECNEIECIDIDFQEDFELANNVYMNMIKK